MWYEAANNLDPALERPLISLSGPSAKSVEKLPYTIKRCYLLPRSSAIGSGKPVTMRAVSTLTWTIRRIAATSSRGSSNQPLGSLTMPLSLFCVIRYVNRAELLRHFE